VMIERASKQASKLLLLLVYTGDSSIVRLFSKDLFTECAGQFWSASVRGPCTTISPNLWSRPSWSCCRGEEEADPADVA